MKLKYEYNGKFMAVIQKITGAIILSVLWLLLCIPVFTIGPSTKALYHSVEWVLRYDLGYPAKEFFREFRKQFKKTVAASVPFLIIAGLACVNLFIFCFIWNEKLMSTILCIVLAVVLLLAMVWEVYLSAHLNFFDGDDARTSIRTSYILMWTHPVKTLAMFVLFIVFVLLLRAFPIVIAFLPAVFSFFHSLLMDKVLQECAEPEDWENRQEKFRQEREKYEQELNDRAREILHKNDGDNYL